MSTAPGLREPAALTVPTEMAAAVLGEPGTIYLTSKPVPEPRVDEVLVRVERASLCGTDLKIRNGSFFGSNPPPPGTFTPGHEYAGTVVALGSSIDEFRIGDRVVTEAHRGCMRCVNCLRGNYTACLNYGSVAKGHRAMGMTVDGGFAEYVANHVSTLHRIPDSISFEEAAVLTTEGTVMHSLAVLSRPVVGASVTIIGPGPIGLLAVQTAKELGASRVDLIGTRQSRLAIGTELGADAVYDIRQVDAAAAVVDATGGHGADIVLECSGAPDAVDVAINAGARGGSIVLVGFFSTSVTADLNTAIMKDMTIDTVRGEGTDSLERAIALGGAGRLSLARLITHRVPFADIAEAYDILEERRDDAIKVIIEVSGQS